MSELCPGVKVSYSSPSRWPDGTTLYAEGWVSEVIGDVVVFRDEAGNEYRAKRHMVTVIDSLADLYLILTKLSTRNDC